MRLAAVLSTMIFIESAESLNRSSEAETDLPLNSEATYTDLSLRIDVPRIPSNKGSFSVDSSDKTSGEKFKNSFKSFSPDLIFDVCGAHISSKKLSKC